MCCVSGNGVLVALPDEDDENEIFMFCGIVIFVKDGKFSGADMRCITYRGAWLSARNRHKLCKLADLCRWVMCFLHTGLYLSCLVPFVVLDYLMYRFGSFLAVFVRVGDATLFGRWGCHYCVL